MRHLRYRGRAQIEDIAGRVLGHGDVPEAIRHPLDALLHQEIILLLPPIAANQQFLRILLELLDEVINHAMRHARADHIAKAVHPGAQAIDMAERRDERLTADLARPIGRDRQEWARRLGNGDVPAQVAIDRARRGKENRLDPGMAHGFEHVERRHGAVAQIPERLFVASDDVRVGRQMPDQVMPRQAFLELRHVQHVRLNESEPRLADIRFNEFAPAIGEVVVHRNLVPLRQEHIHHMRANKPGSARQKHPFNAIAQQSCHHVLITQA